MQHPHVPFRYAKEIEVDTKDNVIVDFDEGEKQYVVYFSDKMVCRVTKSATFRTKADMDHYLQAFASGKTVQYGRIRFVMRIGQRVITERTFSLSTYTPMMAHLEFAKYCQETYPKLYKAIGREIDSEYVM